MMLVSSLLIMHDSSPEALVLYTHGPFEHLAADVHPRSTTWERGAFHLRRPALRMYRKFQGSCHEHVILGLPQTGWGIALLIAFGPVRISQPQTHSDQSILESRSRFHLFGG